MLQNPFDGINWDFEQIYFDKSELLVDLIFTDLPYVLEDILLYIDLAISLIDRMKKLFIDNWLTTFDSTEAIIRLNEVHTETYSSHHLDAMRGLPDVSFILLDEADFSRSDGNRRQEMSLDILPRLIP